jgi:hypothetical protein
MRPTAFKYFPSRGGTRRSLFKVNIVFGGQNNNHLRYVECRAPTCNRSNERKILRGESRNGWYASITKAQC